MAEQNIPGFSVEGGASNNQEAPGTHDASPPRGADTGDTRTSQLITTVKHADSASRNASSPSTNTTATATAHSNSLNEKHALSTSFHDGKHSPGHSPSTHHRDDSDSDSESEDEELIGILNGEGGAYPAAEIRRVAEDHANRLKASDIDGIFTRRLGGPEGRLLNWITAWGATFSSFTSATTVAHAVREVAREHGYVSFKLLAPELDRVKTIVGFPGLESLRWEFFEGEGTGIVTVSHLLPMHVEAIRQTIDMVQPVLRSDPISRYAKIRFEAPASLQGDLQVGYNMGERLDAAFTVSGLETYISETAAIFKVLFSQSENDALVNLRACVQADHERWGAYKDPWLQWVWTLIIKEEKKLASKDIFPMPGVDYGKLQTDQGLVERENDPWAKLVIPRPGTPAAAAVAAAGPSPAIAAIAARAAARAAAAPPLSPAAAAEARIAANKRAVKRAVFAAARAVNIAAARAAASELPASIRADMEEAEKLPYQVWLGSYTITAKFWKVADDPNMTKPPIYDFEMRPDNVEDFNRYADAVQEVYNDIRRLILDRFEEASDEALLDHYGVPLAKPDPSYQWGPVVLPRYIKAFWGWMRAAGKITCYRRIDNWAHNPDPGPVLKILGKRRRTRST
ncbi:hypothetical protein BV25DRAFT_1988238 [Artomyces pyxidatus]|uniref:Uncharacterized protein n=1 Tax=Artomyces pyxidatus TaxID=48021 RepID=A0ACB8TDI1_9AGAM|nr:hypothetical protein BV25DRAFT_1988238 [Artomyces pyxidatus]